jgi:hypothetical protein
MSNEMKLSSWQVRTMLLIGTLGPPVASLILMTTAYLHDCAGRTEPVDVPCFVVAFGLFRRPRWLCLRTRSRCARWSHVLRSADSHGNTAAGNAPSGMRWRHFWRTGEGGWFQAGAGLEESS